MEITVVTLIIWLVIAAVVGFAGELIARRRAPDGFIGAIVLGFIAIFLVVGVFHFSIAGEPRIDNVPLISSILAAIILVVIWSGFAYHRVHPYASRYYRRGAYVRRPRARRRFF